MSPEPGIQARDCDLGLRLRFELQSQEAEEEGDLRGQEAEDGKGGKGGKEGGGGILVVSRPRRN